MRSRKCTRQFCCRMSPRTCVTSGRARRRGVCLTPRAWPVLWMSRNARVSTRRSSIAETSTAAQAAREQPAERRLLAHHFHREMAHAGVVERIVDHVERRFLTELIRELLSRLGDRLLRRFAWRCRWSCLARIRLRLGRVAAFFGLRSVKCDVRSRLGRGRLCAWLRGPRYVDQLERVVRRMRYRPCRQLRDRSLGGTIAFAIAHRHDRRGAEIGTCVERDLAC